MKTRILINIPLFSLPVDVVVIFWTQSFVNTVETLFPPGRLKMTLKKSSSFLRQLIVTLSVLCGPFVTIPPLTRSPSKVIPATVWS